MTLRLDLSMKARRVETIDRFTVWMAQKRMLSASHSSKMDKRFCCKGTHMQGMLGFWRRPDANPVAWKELVSGAGFRWLEGAHRNACGNMDAAQEDPPGVVLRELGGVPLQRIYLPVEFLHGLHTAAPSHQLNQQSRHSDTDSASAGSLMHVTKEMDTHHGA
jgi:hypothetical protein